MTDEIDAGDVVEALLGHPSPVVTAPDLAADLGCSGRHVLNLLRGLEATGVVESRDVGARAVAWWHRDRVLPPPAEREEPAERDVDESPDPDPRPADLEGDDLAADGARGAGEPVVDDVHPGVREAVDRAAEWWGDDDRLDDRREAATVVLEAVRESDAGLSKRDILAQFAEEYDVAGQSERTWWRRNLAEGAEEDDAPAPLRLVADYSRGTHRWTWTGLDDVDG